MATMNTQTAGRHRLPTRTEVTRVESVAAALAAFAVDTLAAMSRWALPVAIVIVAITTKGAA